MTGEIISQTDASRHIALTLILKNLLTIKVKIILDRDDLYFFGFILKYSFNVDLIRF